MIPLAVITWVCVVAFMVTIIITVLALLGKLRLGMPDPDGSKHHRYLTMLMKATLIEICAVAIVGFGNYIYANNSEIGAIQSDLRAETADSLPVNSAVLLSDTNVSPNLSGLTNIVAVFSRTNIPPRVPEIVGRPNRMILTAKVYATSDKPTTDRDAVDIPKGWKYVSNTPHVWTKNNNATFNVTPKKNSNGQVTSVEIVATAKGRSVFGARNWIGVNLSVVVEQMRN